MEPLQQPGHHIFVARFSESSQMSKPCLGAESFADPHHTDQIGAAANSTH